MRKLVIKEEGRMWPTVTWRDTELVVFYLGREEDCVNVQETRGIDFEKLLTHLDNGGSIFITMKPRDAMEPITPETEECCRWC